ncbi:MAG: 16S rRNA (cytosine(967)-C(5))-methyltransferase RsmB [Lachnospiraceae bacterium]|nr:16S rRNA (cytosine(967)-C(5))-methyltransferase RsmB [Lachnospiraceae bacterium]
MIDTNSREIVLDILMEILEKGNLSHLVLKQALEKYQYLEKQDRAFITRITEGTLEYLIQIDSVINRYSKVKVNKMKPVIRTLLRMSVYQILYMERVPDSAVCNEAVKLAKKRKFQGLTGFVNGVLRNISREKEQLSFASPAERFSIPQWMFSMWEQDFGKDRAEKIASSFLEDRPLTVRCNTSRASVEVIMESLKAQGIQVEKSALSDTMLAIHGYDYLETVQAFAEGLITVQDTSSSLVGVIAAPEKGSFVLDVCSAPGGKSMHVADLMNGTGLVESRDLTEYKIMLVEENIARCGFENMQTKVWDATEFDAEMEGRADIVIADLPCSGLGIIGKKPDIKMRLKEEELDELAKLQKEILSVVSRYVKPGGKLIYSTCTINKKENEENAAWILENLPFKKKEIASVLPEVLKHDCVENQIQLLPGIHPCDGFFIAAFEREA